MSAELTKEQNKEIVRRAIAAISRGDLDGFMADAAEDVTLSVMGEIFPPIQGKPRVMKGLRNALGARLQGGAIVMTIQNLIADGDFVAEQSTGKARTNDGKDYNNTYCRVWQIRDGKIQTMQEYLDTELVRTCLVD